MRILKLNAYTFVEVLISLSIFSLMMASIYSTLILSQRSLNTYAENIAPKQELRKALTLMANDLREANNIFIVKEENRAINLKFQIPKVGDISYEWSNYGENAHKIIRKNSNNYFVIAYHIKSLMFTMLKDNEIIIEISAGENQTLSLKEKVALRHRTGLFAESEDEKIK